MVNTDSAVTPALTPSSITASYNLSILVRRWGGALIDLAVIAALFLLPDLILGNGRYRVLLPILIFLAVAYFSVIEGLTGRSLGKLVTRTVVVDEEGRRPGLWKGFLRTITRLIEVNPFLLGGIPAGIAIIISKKKQRFGDMLAKTYVLKSEDMRKIPVRLDRA